MEQMLVGLRAAAEPTRLRMLALCARGELSVSELTTILSQSQPRVSRHLKLLCEAGLLERQREGNWVFHRVAREGPGGALARALVALVPEDDPDHKLDLERLDAIRNQRALAAAEYFGRNAGQWDEIRALHVGEKEVERLFAELIPPGRFGDLLDIGTGTGRIVELLAPHVGSATGIDLSREMLAVARDKLGRSGISNTTLRHGDMHRLPLPTASMDAVTLHQVLHFAEDPATVVAEAARVLRPGGRLLIADFGKHDLEFLRSQYAHRRLGFSDREVAGWCTAEGLTVTQVERMAGKALTITIWVADRPDAAAAVSDRARALVGGASFF